MIYIVIKTKSADYKTKRHGDAACWPASGLFNLPNTSLCDVAPVEEQRCETVIVMHVVPILISQIH